MNDQAWKSWFVITVIVSLPLAGMGFVIAFDRIAELEHRIAAMEAADEGERPRWGWMR